MSELKLHIYKGREIEKTYTAETYDLLSGTVEDIMELIDIDKLSNSKNDIALITEVVKMLKGAFGLVKPLIKEIFDGITDDEIRRTSFKEVAHLLINVSTYGLAEMAGIGGEKN